MVILGLQLLQEVEGAVAVFLLAPVPSIGKEDSTNFHLPKSTLVMLVSAFAGREFVLDAYKHAVQEHYRFFSFGDAMFVTRRAEK